MNPRLNPAAQCYIAEVWGKVVGFIAILHWPHPKFKGWKKISRVVVLPDYQGIGIGKVLLNFIGDLYTSKGFRVAITTSHPAINRSLRPPWYLTRQGRTSRIRTGKTAYNKTATYGRHTCSWEYICA